MSRIGKKPINIPSGVDLKINGSNVSVKGPKGQLQRDLHPNMKIEMKDNVVTVTPPSDGRLDRSLHGLSQPQPYY
ncbi:MAG: 50S ribosomal protein L6 [Nitrospinae bacterium]|nr:50S ribosomal protein L6 [Nitrospinota bacterium]